eukprot:GFUD01004713.1.p1 GENE.GFUD01004713.1~~GFUD01004713.1.p1  ORF type:complete len:301 (-),score=85.32 GFUD01004713.1:319-1221(-)
MFNEADMSSNYWKQSLRPLSPGRNGDTLRKKTGRSNSVSSSRRTRSRSVSPSRLRTSTVSSRAKERDAIRFEYKRPSRKTAPPARSRAKSASPSRLPPAKISATPRQTSMPRDLVEDKGDGSDSQRTPLTWAAPSALSWSGTPDREHAAASRLRSNNAYSHMETSKKTSENQTHLTTNSAYNHVNKIEKDQNMSQTSKQILEHIPVNNHVTKMSSKEKTMMAREQSGNHERQQMKIPIKTEIIIPVKKYKSIPSTGSLPSSNSKEGGMRGGYDQKLRRKSLSSFSKKTSVSRTYPGCVIA